MTTGINYGSLMHQAMRGLIRTVLEGVVENGLPGDHHFFITFDTGNPDVEIADWLSDRYPGEMTVVMQHWYDDLEVSEDGFAVTLNFGDAPERLYIPFDAILTFVDPSVEFGLRFETTEVDESDDAELLPAPRPVEPEPDSAEEKAETPRKEAEVVSLDTFRK
ncbi:ClpXP protease specificity-enhancing factor SspB [Marivita sp. GX14005]|uniref:SspB family protein n=1 Tax=Marivita sp. GX14005 TaxID=2942276 RepID=UPI00201953E0|nr:ClpXP protease specificity-enhancing factor SspB [Marivita sp. GX14005]MCL3882470.1 ClpXP protease specificity-enhancing factor SspB [Marivita sp. GX14005]